MAPKESKRQMTVAILFDTTGSMNEYLARVKRSVRKIAKELTKHLPGIRMGIIAYGDHCDGKLMLQECPPTAKLNVFNDFIKKTERTCGGDIPEALECALERLIHWDWGEEGSHRPVIIVTDAPAHDKKECPKGNDWLSLASELAEMGISFYSCLCGKNNEARKQLKKLAKISVGKYLTLKNSAEIVPLIVAAAVHKGGILEDYVAALKQEGPLDKNAKAVLVKLDSSVCSM